MIQSKLSFHPAKGGSTMPITPKLLNKNTHLNIWTWNINCIKKKSKLVKDLLIKHDIDILFITESKIQPKDECFVFDNYKIIYNSNKTSYYHGVMFIYKNHLNITLLNTILPHYDHDIVINDTKNHQVIKQHLPSIDIDISKGHHTEGRLLVIECDKIKIVGTYVPNSGVNKQDPFKRLAYRTLAWDKDLYHYLNSLDGHVIWLGDLNVTIKDNDLPYKANIAGTTMEERDNIKEFMMDWIDTWDIKNDIKKPCLRATWGVHGRFPLRLDYVICNKGLNNHILSSTVDQSFSGSDHVPVGTKFEFKNDLHKIS